MPVWLAMELIQDSAGAGHFVLSMQSNRARCDRCRAAQIGQRACLQLLN